VIARSNLEIRREAARILRQFRDGEITNDEFEDAFLPLRRESGDRALRAIATVTWHFYSDTHEHRLRPQEGETAAMLERCIAFLESGLPYEWERDSFLGIWGLNWLVRGVAALWKRCRGAAAEGGRWRRGPESATDWSVWPFVNGEGRRGDAAG
jgi:hypothetical protein